MEGWARTPLTWKGRKKLYFHGFIPPTQEVATWICGNRNSAGRSCGTLKASSFHLAPAVKDRRPLLQRLVLTGVAETHQGFWTDPGGGKSRPTAPMHEQHPLSPRLSFPEDWL